MMQPGDEHAQSAQWLMASAFQGILSTHSAEHPGYPFGSVVPYMLDRGGVPVFLLSHLSQHTRNLDADGHCGLTMLEAGAGDIQKLSRLSAMGDIAPLDANPDAERYFGYFPHARVYHEQLGFRFYRFEPIRFHWNAGFATARWFAASRVVCARPFDVDVETGILEHMNRDRVESLRNYLRLVTDADTGTPVVMVGIDSVGIDLRVAEDIYRVALPRQIGTVDAARAVLAELASGNRTAE